MGEVAASLVQKVAAVVDGRDIALAQAMPYPAVRPAVINAEFWSHVAATRR